MEISSKQITKSISQILPFSIRVNASKIMNSVRQKAHNLITRKHRKIKECMLKQQCPSTYRGWGI